MKPFSISRQRILISISAAALTAAVIFGLLHNLSIAEAVRLGTSAAALTLECRETVCPTLSLEQLYDRLVI